MGCAGSASTAADVCSEQDCFHGKYKLGDKLGEGNFGQVRVAKLRTSKAVRAAKIMCLSGSGSESGSDVDKRRLDEAKAEAEMMQLLGGHQHCVQLFETFTEGSWFYIVMEKCEVSLVDCPDKMDVATEEYVFRLFRDMLLGIAHLHEVNLVHCDIKPNNFLLGGVHGQTVKLADFGMTCKVPKRGYLTNHCGTAPYMSPEMVARKAYDFRTDVWSMGVTAYVLLYGDFPYLPQKMNPQAMKEQILRGVPEPLFTPTPSSASTPSDSTQTFVRTLMIREQQERCTAAKALRLPYLCLDAPPPHDQAQDLTPTFKSALLKTRELPSDPPSKRGQSYKDEDTDDQTDSTRSDIKSSRSELAALPCDAFSSEETTGRCRF